MDWGAFRTRFERWPRGPAIALIVALLGLLAVACWSPASSAAPRFRTADQHSDLQLYRDIIAGVDAGGDYYEVTATELREANYPLKPFFTFRLPTHATIYALAGERAMVVTFWLLAAGLMVAWWQRLRDCLPFPLLGAAMVLLAGGLGSLLQPQTGLFHESWAALLLALMIAVHRPERPWLAILAGGAALMIRELALPMILAMGGLALIGKRWREAVGWAAVVALFALYMTMHAQWVGEVVVPGDKPSPGWAAVNGLPFALKSIAKVTFGIRLPEALAAGLLLLSLFGWFSVKAGWALRAAILLAGYGAALALFARTDTFYWALIAAPLSFAGLVFVPKALSDLGKAVRRSPYRAA